LPPNSSSQTKKKDRNKMNYHDTNHLTATADNAIAEQLADIAEATHHLTIRAEQDFERDEMERVQRCSEDSWEQRDLELAGC
jgi:hypothetical protein